MTTTNSRISIQLNVENLDEHLTYLAILLPTLCYCCYATMLCYNTSYNVSLSKINLNYFQLYLV